VRVAAGLTRFAVAAVAVAATAGCATPQPPGVPANHPASSLSAAQQSTPPAVDQQVEQPVDQQVEQRLWWVADSAAKSDAGTVKAAQAVRSTRAAAVMLTSQGVIDDNQPVWLVQVEGLADFVCNACSRPSGAAAPRGRFLTMIVGASTFAGMDFGLDSTKADLSRLGAVLDLRSGSASAPAVGSPTSPGGQSSGAACTGDQMTVTLGERQQVMSQPAIVIVFTNTSATGCTLYGYPDVVGLDGNGRQTSQARRSPTVYEGGAMDGPSNVALDAGGQASALVGGGANPIGDAAACDADFAAFSVAPPGTTTATRLGIDFPSCSGLAVTPVVAGSSGGLFSPESGTLPRP
jgi:Domain of unknown function (DUF4232)